MDISARHATPLAKCKCGNNAAVTATKISAMRTPILGVKLRDENAVFRILPSIDTRTYRCERWFRILLKYSRTISLQILARNAEIFSMSIPSLQFSIDRFRHRTRTCFLSNVKVFAYFSCKNRPDGEEKKRKTIESKFLFMCINIRIYIFIFKSVKCKFLKNINVVLIVSDTLWIFPLSSSLIARRNFILFKN